MSHCRSRKRRRFCWLSIISIGVAISPLAMVLLKFSPVNLAHGNRLSYGAQLMYSYKGCCLTSKRNTPDNRVGEDRRFTFTRRHT